MNVFSPPHPTPPTVIFIVSKIQHVSQCDNSREPLRCPAPKTRPTPVWDSIGILEWCALIRQTRDPRHHYDDRCRATSFLNVLLEFNPLQLSLSLGSLPSDWPCKRDPLMDQMMDQLRSRPVARPTDGPRLWQPWCRQPRQMLTRLTWMSAWRGWQHNRGVSDRCWPDLRGYGQRKINGPDGIWFILVLVFSLSGVVVGRANINNDKVLRLFTSDGSL